MQFGVSGMFLTLCPKKEGPTRSRRSRKTNFSVNLKSTAHPTLPSVLIGFHHNISHKPSLTTNYIRFGVASHRIDKTNKLYQ